MSLIWTSEGTYTKTCYDSESDLENVILEIQSDLFGENRIYLDIKKKIGDPTTKQNIPDGYLIDLNGRRPKLYVVENELASHDPLRHVAVQLLEFSLSFDSDKRSVKNVLFDAIQNNEDIKVICNNYVRDRQFRNLDHMVESMVFDASFAALVIIDEMSDRLETVLVEKFKFSVDVLEIARYVNENGEYIYQFEPFLENIKSDLIPTNGIPEIDVEELDTIVVPARIDGFEETFLGENCWYAVRINGTMRSQIQYIAAYQVSPVSAITHIAQVSSIEPWKDTGKYIVYFSKPAEKINPIKLVPKSRVRALQNLRYTTLQRLKSANTLDDIW